MAPGRFVRPSRGLYLSVGTVDPMGEPVPYPCAVTWMERAQCRGEDPSLWFPSLGTDPVKALVICSICPVREECLNYARAHVETVGVWGGATQQERRKR
jgi:WhiB family redox-sensing transcriptional regulator